MNSRIQYIARVLAFRENKELSYGKKHDRLNEARLKTREIAKTTLMNWVTCNILQIMRLEAHMELPAQNWSRFRKAVLEQKVSYLYGIDISRQAKRYSIHPSTLNQAITQQLEMLGKEVPLHESQFDYEMHPCKLDNFGHRHDFWIQFEI